MNHIIISSFLFRAPKIMFLNSVKFGNMSGNRRVIRFLLGHQTFVNTWREKKLDQRYIVLLQCLDSLFRAQGCLVRPSSERAQRRRQVSKATGAERGSPRGQRRTGSCGAARPLPAACLVQVSALDPRFGQCVGFEHFSRSCLCRQCFETFEQEPNLSFLRSRVFK